MVSSYDQECGHNTLYTHTETDTGLHIIFWIAKVHRHRPNPHNTCTLEDPISTHDLTIILPIYESISLKSCTMASPNSIPFLSFLFSSLEMLLLGLLPYQALIAFQFLAVLWKVGDKFIYHWRFLIDAPKQSGRQSWV